MKNHEGKRREDKIGDDNDFLFLLTILEIPSDGVEYGCDVYSILVSLLGITAVWY